MLEVAIPDLHAIAFKTVPVVVTTCCIGLVNGLLEQSGIDPCAMRSVAPVVAVEIVTVCVLAYVPDPGVIKGVATVFGGVVKV